MENRRSENSVANSRDPSGIDTVAAHSWIVGAAIVVGITTGGLAGLGLHALAANRNVPISTLFLAGGAFLAGTAAGAATLAIGPDPRAIWAGRIAAVAFALFAHAY